MKQIVAKLRAFLCNAGKALQFFLRGNSRYALPSLQLWNAICIPLTLALTHAEEVEKQSYQPQSRISATHEHNHRNSVLL